MKRKQILAEVAEYLAVMDIRGDSVLQYDLDDRTNTLRIHVLTEEELETLAGYREEKEDDW